MATVQRWLVYYDIPRRSGYERTVEIREKMSRAKIGTMTGENNPNWKGGISIKNGERSDPRVAVWRKAVKRRDNNICQKCGIDGNNPCVTCHRRPIMHADHIKPWAKYPELRFDVDNGRMLCEDCHIRASGELLGTLTAKGEGNQQPS